MFGLYVSTGDKKYNRPAAQGGSAAEFGVSSSKRRRQKPNKPTVELYFVSGQQHLKLKEGKETCAAGHSNQRELFPHFPRNSSSPKLPRPPVRCG